MNQQLQQYPQQQLQEVATIAEPVFDIQSEEFAVYKDLYTLSTMFGRANCVSDMFNNITTGMIVLALGREMGFSPVIAQQNIFAFPGAKKKDAQGLWVEGKTRLGMLTSAMANLVRKAGHKLEHVETTDEFSTWVLTRNDGSKPYYSTYTVDDAQRAGRFDMVKGYNGGPERPKYPNWYTQRSNMLEWRAQANACRKMASDCLCGVNYTKEEIEEIVIDEQLAATAAIAAPPITNFAQLETPAAEVVETAPTAEPPAGMNPLPDELTTAAAEVVVPPTAPSAPAEKKPSAKQIGLFKTLAAKNGTTPEELAARSQKTPDQLTMREVSSFIEMLKNGTPQTATEPPHYFPSDEELAAAAAAPVGGEPNAQ
jgi:hypothetical protein